MPYADLGGVTLRYRVSGFGPPLLLIRGLARSLDFWLDLESELARDFTVLVYDNRGVGGSDSPRPPYTTAVMADDAAVLLERLGVERAHVFGISLGGMIAQMLALRHPQRVERLVVGCSTPGRSLGLPWPRSALARLVGTTLLSRRQAQQVVARVTLSAGYLQRHPEIVDRWVELAERWPPTRRGFAGQLAAGALHDPGPELKRIQAPCLLLHGTEDRLIPHENSRRLNRQIPGSRLELLPGAGHDFVVEQTGRTVSLLRDFFLVTAAGSSSAR